MIGWFAAINLPGQLREGSGGGSWKAAGKDSSGWRDKSAAVGRGACGCSCYRVCAAACHLLPSPPRFYLGKSSLLALAASPGAHS